LKLNLISHTKENPVIIMNKIIKFLFIMLIILTLFNPASSVQKQSSIRLHNLHRIAVENHVVGMTVLGYSRGRIRFVYNYGYSDIERKIKVDNNTIFFMASVSKIVTGIAVMKLIEEGKIRSIESDIGNCLGFKVRNPKYPQNPIRIRHIMTHTSGINDSGISSEFIEESNSPDPPLMKELFFLHGKYYDPEIWYNAPPGTKYSYSNYGAILAGAIIGKLSDRRFDIFVNKKILQPAGINHGFTIHNVKDVEKVAVVYMLDEDMNPYVAAENYQGEKPAPLDFSNFGPDSNPAVLAPHGGLRTDVRSLVKIMEIFLNRGVCRTGKGVVRILKAQSVDLMLRTHWSNKDNSGIFKRSGLFIHITNDLIPGVRMYGHSGDAMGLLSAMYFNPRNNSGIIFVMNGGDHTVGDSGFYKIQEQVFRESYRLLLR
jgi:CubicO group peptidase (beta-lactamase class C family)